MSEAHRSIAPSGRGAALQTVGVVVMLLACTASMAATAAAGADASALAQGRALFIGGASPPCALCHTLKDAGSSGAIGPVLDELQPDAARVVTALKSGIGAMPSYRPTLTDAQMQALAAYVSQASGGTK